MAISIRTHMTDVKTLMAKNSDKLFNKIITDIKLEFYSLKVLIQHSTIAHDSQVYQLFEELRTSLSHLMLTDKESSSPTGTTTTVKQATPKQVNLPKLALPTFHGDPMKWSML